MKWQIINYLLLLSMITLGLTSCATQGASTQTYLKRINHYQQTGRYEDAIREGQMLVQFAPGDVRGYRKLRYLYAFLGRYEDALAAGNAIMEIMNKNNWAPCGDIEFQAAILEYSGRQNDAISFLKNYRKPCPDTVRAIVKELQEAIAEGTVYFPPPPKP